MVTNKVDTREPERGPLRPPDSPETVQIMPLCAQSTACTGCPCGLRGQHSVDEKICDEWRRQTEGLPTAPTKQNATVLPSATALALAVGTVTPSRQPTLGCDHDREGPRLLKVAQTVQIPLLSSRCRSPIEVIRIDQSSTAIMALKLFLRLRPRLSL